MRPSSREARRTHDCDNTLIITFVPLACCFGWLPDNSCTGGGRGIQVCTMALAPLVMPLPVSASAMGMTLDLVGHLWYSKT